MLTVRQLAKWYDELFENTSIKTVKVAEGCESSRHSLSNMR